MQGTPYDFFVQWHLTERCNLRCRHCYQSGVAPEMTLAQITTAVASIGATIRSWAVDYDLKLSPSVHFTGGEPLLCRHLFPAIAVAREAGFTPSLMTNGVLVTPDLAKRLKAAGVEDVQVSLDGLEATHDGIRGRGAFQKAVKGIRNLVAAGLDTFVNLTISRLNAGEIEGLAALTADLGLKSVGISRLVPCGRGEEIAAQMLTPGELTDLYRNLSRRPPDSRVLVHSLEPLAVICGIEGKPPQSDFPVGGCAAGLSGITIASDGAIMPCRRMDLTIGNITRDSFREIWAASPVLLALRDRRAYHDGCEVCQYWVVCRGCRAIALAYARSQGREDYLGQDPQCPYRADSGR